MQPPTSISPTFSLHDILRKKDREISKPANTGATASRLALRRLTLYWNSESNREEKCNRTRIDWCWLGWWQLDPTSPPSTLYFNTQHIRATRPFSLQNFEVLVILFFFVARKIFFVAAGGGGERDSTCRGGYCCQTTFWHLVRHSWLKS